MASSPPFTLKSSSLVFLLLLLHLPSSSYSVALPSLRVKQLIYIHRHGDRTPITPLKDHTFWSSQLPPSSVLSALDSVLVRKAASPPAESHLQHPPHLAGGNPPFGQLTLLGTLQMVVVGNAIREEVRPKPCVPASLPSQNSAQIAAYIVFY